MTTLLVLFLSICECALINRYAGWGEKKFKILPSKGDSAVLMGLVLATNGIILGADWERSLMAGGILAVTWFVYRLMGRGEYQDAGRTTKPETGENPIIDWIINKVLPPEKYPQWNDNLGMGLRESLGVICIIPFAYWLDTPALYWFTGVLFTLGMLFNQFAWELKEMKFTHDAVRMFELLQGGVVWGTFVTTIGILLCQHI